MPESRSEGIKPDGKGEYRFEIDAYSPETIPLVRLSQYLADIARMMGESANVHLSRIEKGSTVPIIRVDREAEPKVRDRIHSVRINAGPLEAQRAFREINRRLVEDNANGRLIDASKTKVLQFPGRDAANQPEYGPVSQAGSFQGVPIKVGGEDDPVPVHLEDGNDKQIVQAPRRIAKLLAQHLFTSVVRVEGRGRWHRDRTGEWHMRDFYVQDFQVLSSDSLRDQVTKMRKLPGAWKRANDPLGELDRVRHGEGVNSDGSL